MKISKIFCTRNLPFLQELKHEFTNVVIDNWGNDYKISPALLKDVFKEYDGVITTHTDFVNSDIIDDNCRTKVVSNYATGTDNFDINLLKVKEIVYTSLYDEGTISTAELTLCLGLNCLREINRATKFVEDGNWKLWNPYLFMGNNLSGKTWGIVGFGKIGSKLAEMLEAFNCNIIYTSRTNYFNKYKYCTKIELLKESDIISLHLPLDDDTTNYIDTAELNIMKQTAILINVARGKVINNIKLYEALNNQVISYAALDVTDPEPLGLDKVNLTNLIITPHIGTSTSETRKKMTYSAIKNIIDNL